MKAYVIGLDSDPDVGNEIVFAKNGKEARKIANTLDITDTAESYIDVTVHRAPAYDDTENLSAKEFMLKQWRDGWWFFFDDGVPSPPEEHTDEEFYKWHDEVYAKKM